MNFEEKHKKHFKIIENYFSHAISIIGVGSFFNQNKNSSSDIDLIIIDSLINNVTTESKIIDSLKFDFIIIPHSKIEQTLKKDALIGNGSILHMLSNCTILKDTNGFAKQIIKYNSLTRKKLFKNLLNSQIHNKTVAISNLVDDLNEKQPFLEKLFVIDEINKHFSNLIFNKHKTARGNGKQKYRIMKSVEFNLTNKLSILTQNCIVKNDLINYKKFILNSLEEYGGYTTERSNRDLSIQLKPNKIKYYTISILTSLIDQHKAHEYLCKTKRKLERINKISFLYYKLDNTNLIIYLKIKNIVNPLDIYGSICSSMNINFSEINNIKVSDSYKFEESPYFDILQKLSNLLTENMDYAELDILQKEKIKYIVFKYIVSKQRFNQEELKALKENLFFNHFQCSYDEHLKFDYQTLIKLRKIKINESIDHSKQLISNSVDLLKKAKMILNKIIHILENVDLNDMKIKNNLRLINRDLANTQKSNLIYNAEILITEVLSILDFDKNNAYLAFTLEK